MLVQNKFPINQNAQMDMNNLGFHVFTSDTLQKLFMFLKSLLSKFSVQMLTNSVTDAALDKRKLKIKQHVHI